MIDRGFIKWQPFNSLITPKEVLKNLEKTPKSLKPTLFPEELETLNEALKDAYFSQNEVIITFYEKNTICSLKTYIKEIYPNFNTLKLTNNKIISFNQIIKITSF